MRSGSTSYYEADGLGSVTSLSNSSGALANTYTYDSFGNLTASTGTLTNSLRYNAREFDSETGLYFYRARYYDFSAGHFISEDPIGLNDGINEYVYVKNDPPNLLDPTGWSPECLLDPKSRCARLFQRVFGLTPKQFNSEARSIPWYYSPNANTFGTVRWNTIANNGDQSFINMNGPYALTAAPGGPRPAPVVLGPNWFTATPAEQNATLLHEAVHSITGMGDAQVFSTFARYGLPSDEYRLLGNTREFTDWLMAGCPSQ